MSGRFLIGNMLSAIHNKNAFYNEPVVVEYNTLCESVLNILKDNGYIKDFKVISNNNKKSIEVYLRVFGDKSVINSFKLLSTPGRRLYVDLAELKYKYSFNPFSLVIVSTSKGVMTMKDAISNNVGGQLVCEIF
jgi:small subunit ribosomal protein S8